MGSFYFFFVAYLVGGVTFLPLVVIVLIGVVLLTSRKLGGTKIIEDEDVLSREGDSEENLQKTGIDVLAEKFQTTHEPDVAAGYFAVCREYVPGGINGKPPERTTPAGEIVAAESPSVYQSMYRSIFDRKQTPTIDPVPTNGKAAKRARNVFFVVLRHGHLMLYDDSEELEVRYVISLAHHSVGIHGDVGKIPESELWIKRNAISLIRKPESDGVLPPSKPFYFFSENCSDKEDFYFALLRNQERTNDSKDGPPTPQHFELDHIIALVQRLHSSEEYLQTRWINALVGRVFLAIYKTPEVESFVRGKINKKISRVKKPAFFSTIELQKIDMGECAPLVTNPRLRDLTVDGDCCIEADISYNGGFRVEIAASVRIDLGTRFKAREVNLVLALVVKKLDGHFLIKLKPPPSNRLWFTFERMPKIEMAIEPIVSSRQITYGFIIRAIESRIREVIAETLVFPQWDDSPFLDTEGQTYRGGIWTRPSAVAASKHLDDTNIQDESDYGVEADKTRSMPNLAVPKAIGSNAFALAASPIVSTDTANVAGNKRDSGHDSKTDATTSIIAINHRSQTDTPAGSPTGSPPEQYQTQENASAFLEKDDVDFTDRSSPRSIRQSIERRLSSRGSTSSVESRRSRAMHHDGNNGIQPITPLDERRNSTVSTFGSATAVAKKWGLGVFKRRESSMSMTASPKPGTPENPIGRGRPLPPPGIPLPLPERTSSFMSKSVVGLPHRKPLPPPLLPPRSPLPDHFRGSRATTPPSPPPPPPRSPSPLPPPLPPRSDCSSEVMIVKAPSDSAPPSPLDESKDGLICGEIDIDDIPALPAAVDDGDDEEEAEEQGEDRDGDILQC